MTIPASTVGLLVLALAAALLWLAWYIAGRGSDAYQLPYLGFLICTTAGLWIIYAAALAPTAPMPALRLW